MEEKRKDKPMSGIGFRLMSLMFQFRDLINPPEKHLKETKMKEGDKILDYGCGPGSFVFSAANIVGEKGKVCAVDLHPLAIKMINKKAVKKELTNIETIQTNCITGLTSKSIDIVLMYDVIHMFNDPIEIFREIHRIIKPNGLLSICNPHMKEKNIIKKIEENSNFKLTSKGDKTFSFKNG
ncbi:MAG: class I SAM-dependent methyltransferase [Asgard group archaeon]|nr:class I SAM-dependent methyltransferase [Asgard group archaeon]